MPEAPTPTYREQTRGEQTLYECLIPDAGKPEQICGHLTLDEGRMTEHMAQRHAGAMIKQKRSEEEHAGEETQGDHSAPPANPLSPAAAEATSPRTAGQQEHPPQVPIPTPHPHEPIPPAEGEPA